MENYKQKVTRELYEAIWAFIGVQREEVVDDMLAEVLFQSVESPMILSQKLGDKVMEHRKEIEL